MSYKKKVKTSKRFEAEAQRLTGQWCASDVQVVLESEHLKNAFESKRIPLVGSRVGLIHHGKFYLVTVVTVVDARGRSLSNPDLYPFFEHSCRALYGAQWASFWFEATVKIDGMVEYTTGIDGIDKKRIVRVCDKVEQVTGNTIVLFPFSEVRDIHFKQVRIAL